MNPPRLRVGLLHRFALLLTVAAAAGCSSGNTLVIQLQTDLVPGLEFDEISIDGPARESRPATLGESFARPLQLAEYRGLASGQSLSVSVELRSRGSRVVARRVQTRVQRDRIITVIITRNCVEISCPDPSDPEATECQDGQCVRPQCDDGSCSPAACAVDSDCPAAAECAIPRCTSGTCLTLPDPARCGSGLVCVPDEGCIAPIPSDAGTLPDALHDAGLGLRRPVGLGPAEAILEMPGYATSPSLPTAPVPLGFAFWMDDGRLVVSAAACNPSTRTRGFWVFAPDGTTTSQDTCLDSLVPGARRADLSLNLLSSTSNQIHAITGPSTFIMGGTSASSHPYPPKHYDVDPGPAVVWRSFALDPRPDAMSSPPEAYSLADAPQVLGLAAVPGRVVATVESPPGVLSTVVYSLPTLDRLATSSTDLTVVASVGEYVVATRRVPMRESGLYVLGDDGALTPHQLLPWFVPEMGTTSTPLLTVDPLDPGHVLVSTSEAVHELRLELGRLTEVRTRPPSEAAALFGDATLVGGCDDGASPTRCGVSVIDASGLRSPRSLLPDERSPGSGATTPAGRVRSIAVSREGTVVAVTDYGAYRMRLVFE